jgi:cystathionine beta-lyase/cystathionine gamma-synthase
MAISSQAPVLKGDRRPSSVVRQPFRQPSVLRHPYAGVGLASSGIGIIGKASAVCTYVPSLYLRWTDDELRKAGVTRGMMRLSIGLKDPEDLIADLQQALS